MPVSADRIPDEALDASVRGVNLAPGSLRDQLGDEATLMVFLRHFGCIFCRETVGDLRAASEDQPDFPSVLFFYVGTPIEGKAFMRRYWPSARAVSDPEKRLYAAFGVERGSLLQMFGPGVFRAKSRAAAKGHQMGERAGGDVFMMPGVFLTRKERLVWRYEHRHSADHPDFSIMSEVARAHP